MRSLALLIAAALIAQPVRDANVWARAEVARGIEYHTGVVDNGTASFRYEALRVSPQLVTLEVVHALDQAVGLETVSSMAARHGAIAAVNGGFFRTAGTYRGDSLGALMIDGELLSEPDRGRASAAIIRTPDSARVVFGHARAEIAVTAGGQTRVVGGLNRPRDPDELLVFTPGFHRTTLTPPDGLEAIVRRGRVVRLVDPGGSQVVPDDGFVVSASGDAAGWARRHLRAGTAVTLTRRLFPIDASPENPWAAAEDVLGAGPQLLRGGRVSITAEREQMSVSLSTERHPRTAIGTTWDGRVLLIVVDGRQPGWSDGALLTELADLLFELGADDAINLDGGGSSTMVLEGKVVNRPSDAAGERPVGDALLVLPRKLP